jgi:hypothetical protein
MDHADKPKFWITTRYFGKFNKFRNDHWVFGDAATGAYLPKFAWTPIVQHTMVQGSASPDDPALAQYWARRRRTVKPSLDRYTVNLLARQDGRCPLCGDHLLTADQPPQSPEQWANWWLHVTRRAIEADYLVHHGRPAQPAMTTPASSTPPATAGTAPANAGNHPANLNRPRGLLEPCAGTTRSHGSEGAPVQQCTGATRLAERLTCKGFLDSRRRTGPRVSHQPRRG